MSDATISLSQEKSIQAHLQIAKTAIETGEHDLRRAADHIAQAQQEGASQRQIANTIGKSAAWVNQFLRWRNSGFQGGTPFGTQSKERRKRASVQATERTGNRSKTDFVEAIACAKAAQAQAEKAKAEAERATEEAKRAKAEADRERVRAEKARAEFAQAKTTSNGNGHAINARIRDMLVKTLGMLGSQYGGERDNAALTAEKLRAKLAATWDDLIVKTRTKKQRYDFDEDDIDEDDLDVDEGACDAEEAVQ